MRRLLTASLLAILAGGCGPSGLSFGKHFVWGAATAAHQIEGSNTLNDMWAWEQLGHTAEKSGMADDSWDLYATDSRLTAQAGLGAYRMSIEWSRLEPTQGAWDSAAEAHYRAVLDDLASHGIRPMVTLHHFTNPLWVDDPNPGHPAQVLDSWRDPRTPQAFADFARRAAATFGDRVDLWVTINEPMPYTLGAYVAGKFPPGESNFDLTQTVLPEIVPNLVAAHALAAQAIREADTIDADGDGIAAWVGIAQNVTPVDPAHPSDAGPAARWDAFYNHLFPGAAVTGNYDVNLTGQGEISHPEWVSSLDFIGVNYYTSVKVASAMAMDPVEGIPCIGALQAAGFPLSGFGCPDPTNPVDDNGNEQIPDGLRRAVLDIWQRYNLPIFITENGVATTDDAMREKHLVTHLKALHEAIAAGADVRGYFYWSLMDNYEWGSFAPKFGLNHVDYANDFARSPTAAVSIMQRTTKGSELLNSDFAKYGN